MKSFDVVIVGAGLVGSTLALVLGQCGYRVLLIEQSSQRAVPADSDVRTMALSHASQILLSQCGIWRLLAKRSTPIEALCVTVEKQFGSTHIKAPSSNRVENSALGYVVSVCDIEAALHQALVENNHITIMRPATVISHQPQEQLWQVGIQCTDESQQVTTRLLIAADGNGSLLAQSQHIHYEQTKYSDYAICANFRVETKSPYTAYERFLNNGALALLPWIKPYATCVWTCHGSPDLLMSLSDEDYLQTCQQAFGQRIGLLKSVGKRVSYPISTRYAPYQIDWRFVVMGNAAHQLHPIAAQGLNLSLADITELRSLLQQERPIDLGDPTFLAAYQAARWPTQAKVIQATDKIATLMTGSSWINPLRGMGLTLLDMLPPLKQSFTRWGMGVGA